MPRNQFQRTVFALLTVLVTVHAYLFYSLYVINGDSLMGYAEVFTGTRPSGVIDAINSLGGVTMFGTACPIWLVAITEFIFAFSLEILVGSPASFKLVCRHFDPCETHPVLFETALICATVAIMCPAMSFIAAFLYYPYANGFNVLTLLANWLKLVCFNFPFALITQLFFIQPLIRTTFKLLFRKDIAARDASAEAA